MGSGKSTFSKALSHQLKEYTYVCLDDHRKKKFADILTEQHDPLQFEKEVAVATQREIARHNKIIYETTGATRFFKDIHYQLTADRHKLFLIEIKCPPELCLERHLDREKKGHFHVVPQYGKGLSPEDLINRYADKTRWIQPDLILDSSKYPVEKLVDQFLRKYFPGDKERDITEILNDFNYDEALEWFLANVEGKSFIKEMLSSGEDDFNRLKLKKELNEYLHQLDNSLDLLEPKDKPSEPIKPIEVKTKTQKPVNNNTSVDPLKEEWSPMFKEANFLFIELDHEENEEKREQMVFRILDLMDQVQDLWEKADFIKEHGHAPNFNSAGIEDMSDAQRSKRINTLRTYISKAKKGKLKAEKIPEWEAEKLELEKHLS
jgi:predicted kinase